MASSKISLKLLVDSKRQKVLFAEAGKDFVDFLFTLLSLPIGTVIRLLSKDGMVGSFGKLYESVEDLDLTYMQPLVNKDILLKPKAPVAGPNIFGFLSNVDEPATRDNMFYMCSNSDCNINRTASDHTFRSSPFGSSASAPLFGSSASASSPFSFGSSASASSPFSFASSPFGPSGVFNSQGQSTCTAPTAHLYVTEDPNEQCPVCKKCMSSRATYVGQPTTTEATSSSGSSGAAGYVKGVVTYMIMDDLEVKPMSTISRFNVTDVRSLKEKVVDLCLNEGVKLLKESLQSKEVLSNVFLRKKAAS